MIEVRSIELRCCVSVLHMHWLAFKSILLEKVKEVLVSALLSHLDLVGVPTVRETRLDVVLVHCEVAPVEPSAVKADECAE